MQRFKVASGVAYSALVLLSMNGQARSADTGGASIETVVVTATRRAEDINKVPLSISALSADDIKAKQIVSFKDIQSNVPGVRVVEGKGEHSTVVYIRGQAQSNESVAMDTPVAFFLDDLYYGTTASYVADFFDTEQIAVLKGPQGTTFGRNVDGGAIQVSSAKPELGVTEAYINGTAGNYQTADVWGYVNYAIQDDLAMRLSVSTRNHSGYDYNVYTNGQLNDNHSLGGRLQFRYAPISDLDVQLAISWFSVRDNGDAAKFVGQGKWAAFQAAQTNNDPHKVYDGLNGYQNRDVWSAIMRANYHTEWGEIQSITGGHGMKSTYLEDVDLLINPIFVNPYDINKELQLSQEVRLVSPSDQMITYVAGIYADYSDETLIQNQTWDATQNIQPFNEPSYFQVIQGAVVGPLSTVGAINQQAWIRTFAPYFEGVWHIVDGLDLTAGVRYTITNKHSNLVHSGPSFSYGAIPYSFFNLHHTWYETTPRFILSYHVRDDLMFYASASNGVKSGGWSFSAPTAALAQVGLQPENNWAYEVGMKGTFFDNSLSIAADVYNQTTYNAQIKNLVNGIFIDANAGRISVNGAEVSADWRPTDELGLGVQWAYTDAYYGKFKPCNSAGKDCSGNPLIGVPLNDLLVYASYTYPIKEHGDLAARISAHFASSFSLDPTGKNILPIVQPQTENDGTVDAQLIYTPNTAPWSLKLWAKNLTDNTYIVSAANYYFFALTKSEYQVTGLREVDRVVYNQPRTFGLTFDYKF